VPLALDEILLGCGLRAPNDGSTPVSTRRRRRRRNCGIAVDQHQARVVRESALLEGRVGSMGARRERSLRAMLAGSLVFWGLAAVSVSTVTALTTETAAASSTTLWSSTTPGTYTVTGLPSGIPLTITAVGGSGDADAGNGFAGGEGAIVTRHSLLPVSASL
jgi:hypothetical protein